MSAKPPTPPETIAFRRRLALGCIVSALVIAVASPVGCALARDGWTFARILFLAILVLLLTQIVFASVVAVVGWWTARHWPDHAQITSAGVLESIQGPLPATAIVMPIYNEDVNRVFQGLRAMYESLQETGHGANFDFFILSDTSDLNCAVAEEKAWFEFCKQAQGFGRIFYRRRRVQLHHKSGNIADFCRRWGANYRYMIVLDADSVMTGDSLVRLTALMEQRPAAGIIQTTTRPILGETLFQRMEQFSAFAYRPLFAGGASFWQLGDATFWGHNAIIRLKPFMEHCAMPQLPEVGPLGRNVLSHDTIEAALMRRGGYEVWEVNDLEGSFEEGPPHLLDSLKRDRRWCHGNLQHIWFLFERGLKMVSRFNILLGILAYGNSPVWLVSMILGVVIATQGAKAGQRPALVSGVLYACIMAVLLLPKALGALLVMQSPAKLKIYGSRWKVLASVLAETIYSMLAAPILMLFYTRFVLASLCGIKVTWGPQNRGGAGGPTFGEWFRVHGVNMAIALGVLALLRHSPGLLPWMVPVLAGPILAIPFSQLTASRKLGTKTRATGLFLTPEEIHPPRELVRMEEPFLMPALPFFRSKEYAADFGLLQAVLDPYVNAIHCSLLRQRPETTGRTRAYMNILADRLLMDGPFTLTRAEKRTLFGDAEAMSEMHQKLWGSPSSHLHEWWQAAFRNYVETTALATRRTVTV